MFLLYLCLFGAVILIGKLLEEHTDIKSENIFFTSIGILALIILALSDLS